MEKVYVVIRVENGEYCGIEGIFKSERDAENRAVSLKLMYQNDLENERQDNLDCVYEDECSWIVESDYVE